MYAVTSIAFVRRTRATLRSAEFGFFGVCVNTRVHTPRFCGAPWSAGVLVFPCCSRRPLRTNWFTVGNACPRFFSHWVFTQQKAGMGGAQANLWSMVADPGRCQNRKTRLLSD